MALFLHRNSQESCGSLTVRLRKGLRDQSDKKKQRGILHDHGVGIGVGVSARNFFVHTVCGRGVKVIRSVLDLDLDSQPASTSDGIP